jgi:hypothetical protein
MKKLFRVQEILRKMEEEKGVHRSNPSGLNVFPAIN